MQFQCCISNCSTKPGVTSNLYALPKPTENQVLIENWVRKLGGDLDDLNDVFSRKNLIVCEQHFQDLCKENSEIHDKNVLEEPKEIPNEIKTIDAEKEPQVEVRKCADKNPNVISQSAEPVYVLQKMEVNGKATTSLLLLQPINRQYQNKERNVRAITSIQEPKQCSRVMQEVQIHTTETSEKNGMAPKNIEYKVDRKDSSHQVVDMINLTKTENVNAIEAKTKVFAKGLCNNNVNHTSEGSQKPFSTYQNIILKCRKNLVKTGKPVQTVGTIAHTEIGKPTLFDINKELHTPLKEIVPQENPQINENKKPTQYRYLIGDRNLSSHVKKVKNSSLRPKAPEVAKYTVTKIEDSNINIINSKYSGVGVAGVSQEAVPEVTAPNVEISEFASEVELPEVKVPVPAVHDGLKPQVPEIKLNVTPKIIITNTKDSIDQGCLKKTAVQHVPDSIKRRVVAVEEVNKMIETIKKLRPLAPDTPPVSKNLTIDSATLQKLTYEEAENVKRIMKSYNEQIQNLLKEIKILKKQIIWQKKRTMIIKKRLSDLKVNSRAKAFEKITKGMAEDTKMIIRMQVANHKKKPEGRRFNLNEKLFALALFKLSRQAYRYLSTILALPKRNTIHKFLEDLHTKLLVNDSNADVSSHDIIDGPVTDDISHGVENNIVTNYNSTNQINDETVAAVAAITDESARPNIRGCIDNNVTKRVVCVANETDYPNFEVYTDDAYIQNDILNCNSAVNEIVISNYVEQTNDQIPNIIKIPTNFGTIRVGYSEYTQEFDQYPFAKNQRIESLKKGNIINHKKRSDVSNPSLQKSKCAGPTVIEEKNKKIDFILSKMLTPDQLTKVYPKPRKKVRKTGDAKKKIEKPDEQSGIKKTTKSVLKTKNDMHEKTMKLKTNSKKVTPTLSHHTQTKPILTIQPDIHEDVSEFDRVMANRASTEMYMLGPTSKHKRYLQQNIPCKQNIQLEQPNASVICHTTDGTSSALVNTTNNDDIDLSAIDTVTKLRKNLKKYSPKKLQRDTSFIEAMSQTNLQPKQMICYRGKRKVESTVKATNHCEKETVEVKRPKKLVIDESGIPEHSPRRSVSPEMIVRSTQDANRVEDEINPSQHPEGSARDRGFDMPNLNEDCNSSYDSTNRKNVGFKRLPTNPY